MNAHRLVYVLVIFALLLGACAPAAQAPSTIGEAEKQVGAVQPEGQTNHEYAAPVVQATAAPAVDPSVAQVLEQNAANSGATDSAAPLQAPAMPVPPMPTPVDAQFQNYGVNPYVSVAQDHLSTFALDVDTASYSVMRSYIQQGSLPPADSVRVEEYVNYFNQGYPTPSNVAFGVYADGALSPFANDGSYLLRIGVQGYQVTEAQRNPLVLTFVIDISGSMQINNRLGLVKDSLALLVDRLQAADTVAIVVYGSTARVALQPTAGSQKQEILSAIYSLANEGATNAEAGLLLGYELAMGMYRPGSSNRVILCSDGVANVGATGPDEILRKVHGFVEEGIYLTTIGVGMDNFNDVLLEKLADEGNGNYAYIDNMDEARKLFVDELTSTLQVIALNAKVQVDFNSDTVAYYRLIGYENRAVADQDFRNNAVDAGEIGAGHSATALYAVVLRPDAQGLPAQGRLATVQLRWEDPATHQVQEINGNFNTYDLDKSFYEADAHYQVTVLAAQYAEILRGSPWAYNLSLSQLASMAAETPYTLLDDQDVLEFAQLLQQAAAIR